MSLFDQVYIEIIIDVIENGVWDKHQMVRPKWKDGTPAYTKSLICKQIRLDNSEVPILTTKYVAWKTAIHELLWFYVKRTNDTSYLKENNIKIWDEWTRKDNSIGKAYGYQLGKEINGNPIGVIGSPSHSRNTRIYYETTNQVHKLIRGLTQDPTSRRHIVSLWNIDDLWDMSLYPCVWHNQWLVKENKLHLIVGIRSNDLALGNPFNVFQYYVLQRMVSQVTGYEMGSLTFNINDAHIYERHLESLKVQVEREHYSAPVLWINPEVKSFDDFTINDFKLIDYKYHPKIDMEVAI